MLIQKIVLDVVSGSKIKIMTTNTIPELTRKLIDFWDRRDTAGFYELEEIVDEAIKNSLVLRDQELRERIGMLRQWLNEDRITDPKKMITNKDIEHWLFE